jgi:hypothetical protein
MVVVQKPLLKSRMKNRSCTSGGSSYHWRRLELMLQIAQTAEMKDGRSFYSSKNEVDYDISEAAAVAAVTRRNSLTRSHG